MPHLFRVACAAWLLLCCSGCGVGNHIQAALFGQRYWMGFHDAGTQELTHVSFPDSPTPVPCGILVSGGTALSQCSFAIPASATLVWRDAGGEEHQQTLQVRSEISDPDVFDGHIIFELIQDKAGLVIIPAGRNVWMELKARDGKKKGSTPAESDTRSVSRPLLNSP